MNAYKMKEIADKINAERRYEAEKKFYIWLMGEMEVVARNGKYKYVYEFLKESVDFDLNTIINMLTKEDYRVTLDYEDYSGLDILTIYWSDLR